MTDEFKMDGESCLIIGRGRSGKTGFAIKTILKAKPEKLLILAPQFTNPLLQRFDYLDFDSKIMSADDLVDAFNEADGELLLLIREKVKGQPSIWRILRDPLFRDFTILADELAVLVSDADDEREFKIFIRHVGQNNQKFFGTSHRIKDDIPPVTALNVQKIYFVGMLNDDEEIGKLWSVSNLSDMSEKQFAEKLKSQPKKFNWWDRHPNEEAVFLIFS